MLDVDIPVRWFVPTRIALLNRLKAAARKSAMVGSGKCGEA
jgi:hypothetical protein